MASITITDRYDHVIPGMTPLDALGGLKRTRYGIASAANEIDGDGPSYPNAILSSATNEGLNKANVLVFRKYLQPGERITAAVPIINDMALNGGICMVSGKWDTLADFTQMHTDLGTMDPTKAFINITQHEPVKNVLSDGTIMTPSKYDAIQNMFLDACQGYAFVKPSPLFNGYWFSGSARNRRALLASGGFIAWMPDATANRFVTAGGYLLWDSYPGGSPAKPGNVPPALEKPGEGPAIRIRNGALWAAGLAFTDNSSVGTVPGSTVVWPKRGCGEVSAYLLQDMLDAFDAGDKYLDILSWWNHRIEKAGLENFSPPLPNGNGGNPDSARWKARYQQSVARVQAAGGPPAI